MDGKQPLPTPGASEERQERVDASPNVPLTTRDVLLCRDDERDILLRAYQSVGSMRAQNSASSTQLAMIHGLTGTGKTSLAFSLQPQVVEDGGYFLYGKFDHFQGTKPHDAIANAFGSFCNQVSDIGEKARSDLKQKILQTVGGESNTLTRVIPELRQFLLGQDGEDPVEAAQGSEAINRFKYLFRLFVQAVSSPDRSIVLFMDDIHWADESSLDLLWSLINNPSNRGVLFLFTVRDDSDTSLIEKHLSCMSRTVDLTKLTVDNFSTEDVNAIMSAVLNKPKDQTRVLAHLISNQTRGNVFFMAEFLRTLQEENLIEYDHSNNTWCWDDEEIGIEFNDVQDLVTRRICRLSTEAQELLKAAACLGFRLDQDCLSSLTQAPIVNLLTECHDLGLLRLNDSIGCFEFSHDCVKDVVYCLVPDGEREAFHYQLGRRLLKSFPEDSDVFNNNMIYVIVSQLLLGRSCIKDGRERSAVTNLCLHACVRAMRQTSFSTSFAYLMQGIDLLGPRKWHDDNDLCLKIYNFTAEVAYCKL